MELMFSLQYLGAAFMTGLVIGSGLFCLGLLIGRLQAGGGVASALKKEDIVLAEDIPGTEEYFNKARKSPEEGGHEHPFEQDLIDLARHSE
jgi:hypothetical protein